MAERRDYLRYIITEHIELKDENGAEISNNAILVDVSFQGMSIELEKKLETGVIIQFKLMTTLLGRVLTGSGVVRNISEVHRRKVETFRIGMQFMEVNHDDVAFLLNKIQNTICERTRREAIEGTPDYGAF